MGRAKKTKETNDLAEASVRAEHEVLVGGRAPRRIERQARFDVDVLLGDANATPGKSKTVKHSLPFARFSMSTSVTLGLRCNQDLATIHRAYRTIDHILELELKEEEERMLRTLDEVEAELGQEGNDATR